MHDLSAFPRLAVMNGILEARYGFMRTVVYRAYAEFGDIWAAEFEDLLQRMFHDDQALADAVRGYVEFALDALRLQTKFEKSGEYINKTYAEASSEVYANREYMSNLYLPGILFSHFLWPHHYRQKEFFRVAFLSEMQRKDTQYFADVGIGTGFYSRLILANLPAVSGEGFDISPTARDYTERQVTAFGALDRYCVHLRDVVADPPVHVTDWLISVEVLEHLEEPVVFLRALRRMLRPGGKAFITAALNAPNADHIYLYRSPAEVLAQLVEAGFTTEQFHSGFGHAPRRPGLTAPEITAFIVT